MKTKINTSSGAVLALLVLTLTANAATQVYDLKADWSDTQNPNGQWSYRSWSGDLLPNATVSWGWFGLYGFEGVARTTTESSAPGFLEPGDIYFQNSARIRWTSPADGVMNISGTVWTTDPVEEELGAATYDWQLLQNETLLKGGFTGGRRDLPYQFSDGQLGASTLQNIRVLAGDRIDLVVGFPAGEIGPNGVNWTIAFTSDALNPADEIENLAIAVFEMNLQNGIENSLDSKLDAALNALGDANVKNDGAACNSLVAFINAVEAQRGKKITNAQADQLITSAQQIRTTLNCAN